MPRSVLSFVIPVRNDAERLHRCLKSIAVASRDYPVEVIVADNGSDDGSPEVAEANGARVVHLPGLRVSQIRNAAARLATSDLLAFIDADHEICPEWADVAVRAMAAPDTIASGAPYHTAPDGNWVQAGYDALRSRPLSNQPVDWLPSGNLIVRKEIFLSIGGFDESLEACEDVDLCKRLNLVGCLRAVPELVSIHYGDPRTLKALFLGELWRGRDDLRVTFRKPIQFRSAVGSGLRIVALAGILFLLVAPFLTFPLWLVGLVALVTVGPTLARARVVFVRSRGMARAGVGLIQSFLVAATYDTARIIALLIRGTHRGRRTSEQ